MSTLQCPRHSITSSDFQSVENSVENSLLKQFGELYTGLCNPHLANENHGFYKQIFFFEIRNVRTAVIAYSNSSTCSSSVSIGVNSKKKEKKGKKKNYAVWLVLCTHWVIVLGFEVKMLQ
jgi:hypothetical protein